MTKPGIQVKFEDIKSIIKRRKSRKTKGKRTNRQMIYETLYRKLKIEQSEPHKQS
jgi:hypothetical protein